MVHGREEMIRRVEMRAVVGADGGLLDGGIFAVRQLVDADTHVAGHARGSLMVIEVLDLWQHLRRIAGNTGLERGRDVDETARHAYSPATTGFSIEPSRSISILQMSSGCRYFCLGW